MRILRLPGFLLLWGVVSSCGSTGDGGTKPNGDISFVNDNSSNSDGTQWDFGSDGLYDLDARLGDTGVTDTHVQDSTPDLGPDVTPPDELTPPDVSDAKDSEDGETVVVPDVIPDLSVDTGNPCGCTSDKPICINNMCVCTGTSCPEWEYCKNGDCIPCDQDHKCGPECVSCAAEGLYCSVDSDRCVECDSGHPCNPGFQCLNDFCSQCNTAGLCGPNCLKCEGSTPDCDGQKCVCNASSCGTGKACDGGVCVECKDNDPNHCGVGCAVCGGGTPHCMNGACALCNTNETCGPTCAPCATQCKPDGSACVACVTDAHCPANQHCNANNECVPNCSALGCQGATANGYKASSAILIGRLDASDGYTSSGDTTNAGNNDDTPSSLFGSTDCWDAAYDMFYRIYLVAGDTFYFTVTPTSDVFDVMLKLYNGVDGDDNGEDDLIQCYNEGSDYDPETLTHTATVDGWITVVIDGRRSFTEDHDWGPFTVQASLTCGQPNCCCE